MNGKGGKGGIGVDVRENPTPSPPTLGATMMRFRKGQWHLSVGEVFSESVSPPPPLGVSSYVTLISPA